VTSTSEAHLNEKQTTHFLAISATSSPDLGVTRPLTLDARAYVQCSAPVLAVLRDLLTDMVAISNTAGSIEIYPLSAEYIRRMKIAMAWSSGSCREIRRFASGEGRTSE